MASFLLLGGARSGKSRLAQEKAASLSAVRMYIATAEAGDAEMADRIARHQSDRDKTWQTLECPIELPQCIREHAVGDRVLLVDCLTLWLSNLMHHQDDIEKATADLLNALANANGDVVLVSNEVGMGLVPNSPMGREFRDLQGRLNQLVAEACDRVEFVAAGLPLVLKG